MLDTHCQPHRNPTVRDRRITGHSHEKNQSSFTSSNTLQCQQKKIKTLTLQCHRKDSPSQSSRAGPQSDASSQPGSCPSPDCPLPQLHPSAPGEPFSRTAEVAAAPCLIVLPFLCPVCRVPDSLLHFVMLMTPFSPLSSPCVSRAGTWYYAEFIGVSPFLFARWNFKKQNPPFYLQKLISLSQSAAFWSQAMTLHLLPHLSSNFSRYHHNITLHYLI